MVVLECSEIRAVSRSSFAILADLAMRGFAISFLTLARIALRNSVLAFFFIEHPWWHRERDNTVQFSTVPEQTATECAMTGSNVPSAHPGQGKKLTEK
jgi:hypothetical protein